jgi:hypothetical protein
VANVASHLGGRLQERLRSVQSKPTCTQLEYMGRMIGYLVRVAVDAGEGDGRTFVRTTWPQLAKGVGFPVMGMGVQQIEDRYQSRVVNTMRYLMREEVGLVDGWEPVYEGREPVGILVRLPAGVAQLVRAAES